MRGLVGLLALAANVLGSPVQPDQSINTGELNTGELNTPQTASGGYHKYVLCQHAGVEMTAVLIRYKRLPNLLSLRSLHVPKSKSRSF